MMQRSCRWVCRTTTRSRWKKAPRSFAWERFSSEPDPHERRNLSPDPIGRSPLRVRKRLNGYDPERVNQFRDQVAEELERLSRLNQDLDAKARGFHEQLRAFRERDKAINDALVSAQQLRNEIREQAEKEAHLIVREARADAERVVEELRTEIRRLQDQLVQLDQSRRAYLAQLRITAERQLSEIQAAEQAHISEAAFRDAAKASPAWLGSLVKD